MSSPFSAATCHIDLSAIVHNFQALGKPEDLMPVIKSDAYGHGLVETAQALDRAGARRFAVGLAQEGATLRQLGHKQPVILLMGCLNQGDWELALRYDLTPVIGSFDALKEAQDLLCRYPGKSLRVAIKADTGMSRLGFAVAQADLAADMLRQTKGLTPELVISHLACADMPEQQEFTEAQTRAFDEFYATLSANIPGLGRSLGNSAAILTGNIRDIARPGIGLYGYDPLPSDSGQDLRWAMSVSTPVIDVREVAKGSSISYGRTFTAPADMRIAIIAAGYATGYSRLLSGNVEVVIRGRRLRQVGRICMGMTCIDVTEAPEIKRGDEAWIMGGGQNGITAAELAEKMGTIPYEILCMMGEVNQRVYSRQTSRKR